MPLFFFIIGFILIDSGFRGNAQALYQQFASDAKGFVALFAIIVILGAVGVSSATRPVAKALLFLVFVVFFVRNGNQIVQGIESAVNYTGSAPSDAAVGIQNSQGSSQLVGSGGSLLDGVAQGINSVTSDLNQVSNAASTATSVANEVLGVVGLFGG